MWETDKPAVWNCSHWNSLLLRWVEKAVVIFDWITLGRPVFYSSRRRQVSGWVHWPATLGTRVIRSHAPASLRLVDIVHVEVIRRRIRGTAHVSSRYKYRLNNMTDEWLCFAWFCHLYFNLSIRRDENTKSKTKKRTSFPWIRCRCWRTFSTDSSSTNVTNPKPLERPDKLE